jgi:hypothetical protein
MGKLAFLEQTELQADDLERVEQLAFRDRVARAAADMNRLPIFNAVPEEAQVVIEALFHTGRSTARVFTGALSNAIFGHPDTVSAVESFLARGGMLEVVFDKAPDSGSKNAFLREFKTRRGAKIRRAHAEHARTVPYHFTVVDGKSYRYVPDKQSRAAVAAFGDEENAMRLESWFEPILSHSHEPVFRD